VSSTAQQKGVIIAGCLLAMFLVEGVVVLATETSESRPRRHVWTRFLLSVVTMPIFALALTAIGTAGVLSEQIIVSLAILLALFCIPALMLVPAILFENAGPSSGGEDDDDDEDGGLSRPPPPRDQPRGDVPLPDAMLGWWRLRDHAGPARRRPPSRRPVNDPPRTPRAPPAPPQR
jgi:hypothetical protein